MNAFQVIFRTLFPPRLDEVFSDEGKERTALRVAMRFSRGNAGVQNGRVTTDRIFCEEMRRMAQRVGRTHLHSP